MRSEKKGKTRISTIECDCGYRTSLQDRGGDSVFSLVAQFDDKVKLSIPISKGKTQKDIYKARTRSPTPPSFSPTLGIGT
jgi:hypothetical protein